MLTKLSTIVLLSAVFSCVKTGRNLFVVGAQLNFGETGQLPSQHPYSGQPLLTNFPELVWPHHVSHQSNHHQKPLETVQAKPLTSVPSKQVLPQVSLSVNSPVSSGIHQYVASPPISSQTPSSREGLSKNCPRSNGQFPTNACNKFLNCWNGVATEQACPEGLLFSARGLHCDYPERVDCKQSFTDLPQTAINKGHIPSIPVIINDVAKGPVVNPPISAVHTTQVLPVLSGDVPNQRCAQSRGQFPTDFCNKYVNCWDGAAIEELCPAGLLFNPSKQHCDFPENVNCNGKLIVGSVPTVNIQGGGILSTTSPPPTHLSSTPSVLIVRPSSDIPSPAIVTTNPTVDTPLKRKCLKSRGTFPSTDCKKFVSCWDDIVEEKECPEGFLFSTNGYCDAAENVNCGERAKISKEVDISDLQCPQSSGTFRDKDKCNSYYICIFNKVIARFNCPEGLYFDENIGVCDYAEKVQCSKTSSVNQQKAVECVHEFSVRTWKTSCITSKPAMQPKNVLRDCADLSFRGNQDSQCEVMSIDDDNSNSKLECPLETGTFRHRDNCKAFYTCVSNKVVAKYECPTGFRFNDNIGVCDYASRVDCSKEPLVYQGRNGVHSHLDKKDTEISECPVEFGTFRDDKNCSSYYTCASRKIVAKYDCPEGFSFNDDLGICDYAERVDCSKPPKMFQIKQNGNAQFPADFQEKVDKCKPGTMFRLNPQCTSACLCKNGVAEIVQCPAGLAYDSRLDKCILPHLARC